MKRKQKVRWWMARDQGPSVLIFFGNHPALVVYSGGQWTWDETDESFFLCGINKDRWTGPYVRIGRYIEIEPPTFRRKRTK